MGFLKDRLAGFAPENKLMTGLFNRRQGGALFGYYHVISDEPVPHTDAIIPRITVNRFKSDLDKLLKHFRPLDFEAFLKGNKPKVPSIMITFDDGYREMREIVAPILLEKGVPAAFFINSSLAENTRFLHRHKVSILIHAIRNDIDDQTIEKEFFRLFKIQVNSKQQAVDYLLGLDSDHPALGGFSEALGINFEQYLKERKPFLTTDDMKDMVAKGFYFGGHSVSHPDYSKIGLDAQISETIDSVDYVQYGLGLPYRIFAFPYSDRPASKQFFERVFSLPTEKKPDVMFGNSGLKQDVHPRMIQRVTLEKTNHQPLRAINIELLHSLFAGNKIVRS